MRQVQLSTDVVSIGELKVQAARNHVGGKLNRPHCPPPETDLNLTDYRI